MGLLPLALPFGGVMRVNGSGLGEICVSQLAHGPAGAASVPHDTQPDDDASTCFPIAKEFSRRNSTKS